MWRSVIHSELQILCWDRYKFVHSDKSSIHERYQDRAYNILASFLDSRRATAGVGQAKQFDCCCLSILRETIECSNIGTISEGKSFYLGTDHDEKNLVDNGGVLDRVHFISQVRTKEDFQYLKTIIQSNPTRYTFRDMGVMEAFGDFTGFWDDELDPDTIYFKMGMAALRPLTIVDDDIVYIHDNTFSDMVQYKLNHPNHLFVSANVINSWRLTQLHNAFMCTLPFAPEYTPLEGETLDWRVSHRPFAKRPSADMDDVEGEFYKPPDYKHKWLPMPEGILDDTPIRNGINDCSDVDKWQCGVIAHYSLFKHLEKGTKPFNLFFENVHSRRRKVL